MHFRTVKPGRANNFKEHKIIAVHYNNFNQWLKKYLYALSSRQGNELPQSPEEFTSVELIICREAQ